MDCNSFTCFCQIWKWQWTQTRQINKRSMINHKLRITVLTSQSLMYLRTSFQEHNILLITHSYLFIANSTMVIKKIKDFLRSIFNVILSYVTMGYEKWYTPLLLAKCENNNCVWISKKLQLRTSRFYVLHIVLTLFISY